MLSTKYHSPKVSRKTLDLIIRTELPRTLTLTSPCVLGRRPGPVAWPGGAQASRPSPVSNTARDRDQPSDPDKAYNARDPSHTRTGPPRCLELTDIHNPAPVWPTWRCEFIPQRSLRHAILDPLAPPPLQPVTGAARSGVRRRRWGLAAVMARADVRSGDHRIGG